MTSEEEANAYYRSTMVDPSAADAVEDDMNEWEPLVMMEDVSEEEEENMVDANVQEMLQAVDALLAQAEENGSAGGSTGGSVTSDDEEKEQPQEGGEEPIVNGSETNGHHQEQQQAPPNKKKKRESPLKLRRRLKAARAKLQKAASQPVKKVTHFSVKATRKMLTGSTDKRVRDFVVMPRVVRVLDKYTFTWGIMGMLLTQAIVLDNPSWFRYYFIIVMSPLLALRVVLFQRTKQQYFLLDYCYWVNGLGFALVLFPTLIQNIGKQMYPNTTGDGAAELLTDILWQIFFISANGPLFFAMIAWNNSLVFHSVDKVTSTYVHLFPALLSMCERWRSDRILNSTDTAAMTWSRHVGYPMLFYATWQIVYLLQTEWWHKDTLDADPELSTSLRYLTSAEKMAINKKTLHICRNLGLMGQKETFHPPTVKVKCIFVFFQAIMTFCVFLPVRLFYEYELFHNVVVVAILTFSVYNGARYYIQVFSKIYEKRYNDPHGAQDEEYVDTSALMTEHAKKE